MFRGLCSALTSCTEATVLQACIVLSFQALTSIHDVFPVDILLVIDALVLATNTRFPCNFSIGLHCCAALVRLSNDNFDLLMSEPDVEIKWIICMFFDPIAHMSRFSMLCLQVYSGSFCQVLNVPISLCEFDSPKTPSSILYSPFIFSGKNH